MPTNGDVSEPTKEEIDRHFYVVWILRVAFLSWLLMGIGYFFLKGNP
jgi:hypothetical protein